MSSSRSIAAARNRRSGDISVSKKTSQPGRPMQSIGGQSMLHNQPPQPPMNKQVGTKQPNGLPFSKLSVSDAIGLITLRLGKVEQFMIDSIENGVNGVSSGESGVAASNNKAVFDQSVLINIINRIDALEKKQLEKADETKIINQLDVKVNGTEERLSQLKESINQFIQTTNDKFVDIENAFVELEKNIAETEDEENEEEKESENESNDQVVEEKEVDAESENIHFSVNDE